MTIMGQADEMAPVKGGDPHIIRALRNPREAVRVARQIYAMVRAAGELVDLAEDRASTLDVETGHVWIHQCPSCQTTRRMVRMMVGMVDSFVPTTTKFNGLEASSLSRDGEPN